MRTLKRFDSVYQKKVFGIIEKLETYPYTKRQLEKIERVLGDE